MSAQIYSNQPTGRRFPLSSAANYQPHRPHEAQPKPKAPSPPLPRQKATPPSPPSIIRDKHGSLEFQKIGFLGEGGFARVYGVQDVRGNRVACKVVTNLATTKTRTKLYAEIKIHQSLSHPNIVGFQECFEGDDNVYMILEFTCTLTKVIHRDLKLGNIFLDGKMNVKIGDFGLAALIENPGERKKTICGTPNYIAPEVLFDQTNGHSYEVDIWSIGVILYTLLVGRPPFQTKEVKAIYKRIRDNEYEFPSDRPIAPASKELIQLILAPKPEQRPALLDAVHHSFFTTGTFPPSVPTTAYDVIPDFRTITRNASEANFCRVRRAALLDETTVPSASTESAMSDVPARSQEKEFQQAVQPGSPLSALLKSAKRPLLRSNGPPDTKEAPLFRKLQAASANPSPLRQGSGPGSTRAVAANALGHIAEEDDVNDELGKKRKNRAKELEAQKARIVVQMAPVREEEQRYEARAVDQHCLPERKEVKKPSVKENRLPALAAPIAEPKTQLTGFDAAAHVLTVAFEAKAAGRLFRDPRKNTSIPLPEEKLFIVSWIDYCHKYGMGYAMTDGSVGVYFNDSSSMVLSADKRHFDVVSVRRNGSVYVRKSYTVDEFPDDLQPKVYLLKHFEQYIMARLYGEYDYTYEDTEKKKGMPWVMNYLRMKQVILFKLSHDVLQFNFYDHSKIILSSSGLVVTHIDKNCVLTRWTLSEIMRTALRMGASTTVEFDQDAIKFNQKLVDKLNYCKEVLVSIRSANSSGDDGEAAAAPAAARAAPSLGTSGMRLQGKSSKASLR
ncbi:kinase-like protein [Gymnopus androsaceus JB14]|uniref:Serine/threonine-protein kinase n=1 Tax=Gymnopus androsaceus JB14 TaxID=1447944 RepID=A0A6A4INZ4_9AGAR|nr:kinase-like protein [Gymnopus androsaceus JB14]